MNLKSNVELLPTLIRLKDAPTYLGMDRHRFNDEVRPKKQKSLLDRKELLSTDLI